MSRRTVIDQLGTEITIPDSPQRIISLVPSQTELLADLGLEGQVVGVTKFCIHPESWNKTKTIIGGTKNFRFDVIDSLNPDLIIGNKEENYQEGITRLQTKYPVWMSDIVTIQDALNMIRHVGDITNTSHISSDIINQIIIESSGIKKIHSLRTLYLIWRNPWMGAAPGTFIHEMLTLSGFENCLAHDTRYPELSNEKIATLNPELIFLSSEPYPFQQKHIEEIQRICPRAKIILVDGEMFSWYGSRLLKFPAYLESLTQQLL